MIRALLLDLDGTLLQNDLETFTPVYFRALSGAVAPHADPGSFLSALGRGVQAMVGSRDRETSNAEVFWAAAEPHLSAPREALEPVLTQFYDEGFGALSHVTQPVAGAGELVAAARAAGLALAVATQPMMPRRAILHRLAWAGLDPQAFALITCFETMHSTKPHPSYFLEAAERLGCAPEACLMAGNDLADDLVGAQAAGMRTFFVDTFPASATAPDSAPKFAPDARGSLADLRRYLFGDG